MVLPRVVWLFFCWLDLVAGDIGPGEKSGGRDRVVRGGRRRDVRQRPGNCHYPPNLLVLWLPRVDIAPRQEDEIIRHFL